MNTDTLNGAPRPAVLEAAKRMERNTVLLEVREFLADQADVFNPVVISGILGAFDKAFSPGENVVVTATVEGPGDPEPAVVDELPPVRLTTDEDDIAAFLSRPKMPRGNVLDSARREEIASRE